MVESVEDKTGGFMKRVSGWFGLIAAFMVMGCKGEVAVDEDKCEPPAGVSRPDGWEVESHCKGIDANYDLVFADDVVKRIDITIDPSDYDATMDDLEEILGGSGGPGGGGSLDDSPEPMYVPVQVDYNGLTWWNVGMRYKGNSSLHSAWRHGTLKLAFRFNFDKFEDDFPETTNQRFYGFKKMTFSSGFKDDSLIRDKVAADIFRDAGVPAARGTFVQVYVDYGEGSQYFGLYTMIEDPSDEMLETQFDDDSGNLYKPEGRAATFRYFVEEGFEKKTNEDEADWSDIIATIEALNANGSDASQWRSDLETVFNVDAFLRCLAVNQVIVNWDSYGQMNHNYYVYGDPSDNGRLVWMPWDLNEAMLVEGPGGKGFATSVMLDVVDDEWPLIRFLLDDEVYREQYKQELQAVLDGAFEIDRVQALLERSHSLIAPYVNGSEAREQAPYTFLRNMNDFDNALSGSRGLLNHVEDRHEAVKDAIEDD